MVATIDDFIAALAAQDRILLLGADDLLLMAACQGFLSDDLVTLDVDFAFTGD